MKYQSALQESLASLKRVGFKNSFLLAVSRVYDIWFDRKYGLETAKRLELEELEINEATVSQGQMYQPSGVLPFRYMLKRIKATEDDVFVDFGSGKGRTLIIAAMEGFKRVVGVEFSEELVACAEENIKKLKQGLFQDLEIENICCDAANYQYQDDETIFYFFFPFDDDLMKKVLDAIVQSAIRKPREIRVVYYYPVHASVIDGHKNFVLVDSMNTYGYGCLIYKVEAKEQ